ncbi:hypothetical protein [Streptomyces canus]|uniref:hypothetical protein n=1 Tax=Streptomyces canus TaxID=58343 RepID=UPI00225B9A31|nr:hypothetical protein [Streptomyces canus]MCX4858317.1 hypothetical protein [Streptomyces canus]
MEEEPTVMNVTCHTGGCSVGGVTYTVDMYPNAELPTWRAECAQCGQPITDVVPASVS